MLCQRCGKGEGEYQCQVCHKVVGEECVRTTPEGVFCIDDVPAKYSEGGESETEVREERRTSRGSRNLRNLFVTLLALTAGLWLISYLGQYFINTISGTAPGGADIAKTLQGTADAIVLGLGVFTLLVGLGYAFTYLTSRKGEE